MSKIQAMFSARGRRMFDSERAEADAFNAKFAGAGADTAAVAAKPKAKPVAKRFLTNKNRLVILHRQHEVNGAVSILKVSGPVSAGPKQTVGEPVQPEKPVTYRDARSGEALTRRERSLVWNLVRVP